MYGFVLVEPAEGLPAVGKEFFVVQSEIYAHNRDKGQRDSTAIAAKEWIRNMWFSTEQWAHC